MRSLNRSTPAMPVTAMKTYQISAPPSTHFRKATCAEVDCKHHREGWMTILDETDNEQHRGWAWWIRNKSGRRFTEDRNQSPGLTVFVFEPGQTCFKADTHKVPVGRPPLLVVRDGDWRGNPTGISRRHANADDWIDDFKNNQDKIKTVIEKG